MVRCSACPTSISRSSWSGFIVLVVSLTVHEAAHAWSADRLGDSTARLLGRLSLNPAVHVDPIGTILFPLIAMVTNLPLIGWAKPVPVNPMRLGPNWRQKFMVIAAAGPASNLVLAVIAALILRLLPSTSATRVEPSWFFVWRPGGQHRLGRGPGRPDRPGGLFRLQGRRLRHDPADRPRPRPGRRPHQHHTARHHVDADDGRSIRPEGSGRARRHDPLPQPPRHFPPTTPPWSWSWPATSTSTARCIRLDGAIRLAPR